MCIIVSAPGKFFPSVFSLLTSYFLCLLTGDLNPWHHKATNTGPNNDENIVWVLGKLCFTNYLLCFQQLAMTDHTPSAHHMNIEQCNANREGQDDSDNMERQHDATLPTAAPPSHRMWWRAFYFNSLHSPSPTQIVRGRGALNYKFYVLIYLEMVTQKWGYDALV